MTADELRAAFAAPAPLTVGLEEELMLLDPVTLDLAPRAREAIAPLDGDERFKLELAAAQVEIVTAPEASVPGVAARLADARGALARATAGDFRLAGAGVHPFADPIGMLNTGPRYEALATEYGEIAQRQLVFALQVHVAVGDADAALAVYNALRAVLPELAALAANGPFHGGRDTGYASIRAKLGELLPRQGLPPAIASWEAFARALRWGASSGRFPEPGRWWWELRPHPVHGTLEVRVCDTQRTVADAAALAAVVHCLVAQLVARHRSGEALPVAPTWKIAENRWSANRHGLHGAMWDLDTGEPEPTRRRLGRLLDELAPFACTLRCERELAHAGDLAQANGADRQRERATGGDLRSVVAWLADGF